MNRILITISLTLLLLSCKSNKELNTFHYNKASKYYTEYGLTQSTSKIDSAFEELEKISDINEVINDYNYGVFFKVYVQKKKFKQLKEILNKNTSLNKNMNKINLALVSYYENCSKPDIAKSYISEVKESDVLPSIRLSHGDFDYFVGYFLFESLILGKEETLKELETFHQKDSLNYEEYNVILEMLQEDFFTCY